MARAFTKAFNDDEFKRIVDNEGFARIEEYAAEKVRIAEDEANYWSGIRDLASMIKRRENSPPPGITMRANFPLNLGGSGELVVGKEESQ